LDDALASYHRALRSAPDSYHAQFAIADIYRQQNRPHRTLATLEALADNYAADEVPAEVLVHKGLAQRELGRFADAATTLAAAARRTEPSPDLLVQLAETQFLANDTAAARMTAVDASRQFPDNPRLQQLAAQLDSPALHLAAARNDSAASRQ
jgi:thioredoxin-like negative regulator of GroEL